MYLLYSNIFGTEGMKWKLQHCVYFLVYCNTFQMYRLFCRSLYYMCVYVYCTTATGWLTNCS
jgi:hypothetical protein